LRGPNLWSRHTAVEAIVSCAEHERSITALPGFEARLRALFPGMGALRVKPEEASLAHVLEAATLALQTQAGCPVTFSRCTATVDAGVYQVVVEYSEEPVGKQALDAAEKLIRQAMGETDATGFDSDATIHALRELDEDIRLGPSTGSI